MPAVDLERMWIVTRRLARVPPEEHAALAATLGGALPDDHRAFLERFGAGSFVGVVRVLGPAAIVEQRDLTREHAVFAPHHVLGWRNFRDYFDAKDGERLVPVALSIDGDMLVVHLDLPSMLFVFPRHRDAIVAAETFADALAWFSDSGAYWPRTRRTFFESNVARVEHVLTLAGDAPDPHEAVGHLLEALPPDHDAVDINPLEELFYRDADAIAQWIGNASFRVRADEGASAAFLDRLTDALARGGWRATATRQAPAFF